MSWCPDCPHHVLRRTAVNLGVLDLPLRPQCCMETAMRLIATCPGGAECHSDEAYSCVKFGCRLITPRAERRRKMREAKVL